MKDMYIYKEKREKKMVFFSTNIGEMLSLFILIYLIERE